VRFESRKEQNEAVFFPFFSAGGDRKKPRAGDFGCG
jgi:hypothetical protein